MMPANTPRLAPALEVSADPGQVTKLDAALRQFADGYDSATLYADPTHVLERLSHLETLVGGLAWTVKKLLEEIARRDAGVKP